MLSFIGKFRRSQSGVSAIEFALIIPLMLTTLFGVSEIANYILAARKVSNVASSAADLIAQDTLVTTPEINDIMGALNVIMHPFDTGNATIRVTSVIADENTGNTTVHWSDARGVAPRTQGAPVSIPNILGNGQSVIMAEVSFRYQTLFGEYLNDGMTVTDTFYLKPRRSTKVERVL
ncbi:MAG: TadE/TadG family type IV pilus assembly protein [Micropepsaceae bacterium]